MSEVKDETTTPAIKALPTSTRVGFRSSTSAGLKATTSTGLRATRVVAVRAASKPMNDPYDAG
jgi:hypothetical protein